MGVTAFHAFIYFIYKAFVLIKETHQTDTTRDKPCDKPVTVCYKMCLSHVYLPPYRYVCYSTSEEQFFQAMPRGGQSESPSRLFTLPSPLEDAASAFISRPQHSAGVHVLPIKTLHVVEMRSTGSELHVSHSPNTHMPITAIFYSY